MRQSDNLLKVRADKDHGHTFLGKQRYRVVDLSERPCQSPRWFIENKDFERPGNPPSDDRFLLITAGKKTHHLISCFLDA